MLSAPCLWPRAPQEQVAAHARTPRTGTNDPDARMDAGPTDADTSAWLVASGVMLAYRPAWCSVIFAPLCPQVSAIDTIHTAKHR